MTTLIVAKKEACQKFKVHKLMAEILSAYPESRGGRTSLELSLIMTDIIIPGQIAFRFC